MEKLVACENRNTDLPILLSAADVHTGDALKKNWSVLPDATRSQISITEDYESANYWLYCPYYEVFGVDISFPMRKIASVTAYGKEVISVFERITK